MNLDKLFARDAAHTLRHQIHESTTPWLNFCAPTVDYAALPDDCDFLEAFEDECRMLTRHAILYQRFNSLEAAPMLVEFPVRGIHNSMEVSIKSTGRILTSEEGDVSTADCMEIIRLHVIDMASPTDMRAFEDGGRLLERVVDQLPTSVMFHRPFVTVLDKLCRSLETQGYTTVRATWDQATLAITYQKGNRLWLVNFDVDALIIDYDHIKAVLNPPKDV